MLILLHRSHHHSFPNIILSLYFVPIISPLLSSLLPPQGDFGTPGKATPIHRYTYPSEASSTDYQTKYPHGYNATFPTFHPIEEYSVLNSENKLLFRKVHLLIVVVVMLLLLLHILNLRENIITI